MLTVVIPHRDSLIERSRGLRLTVISVGTGRTGMLRWYLMGEADRLITADASSGRLLLRRIADYTARHGYEVCEHLTYIFGIVDLVIGYPLLGYCTRSQMGE